MIYIYVLLCSNFQVSSTTYGASNSYMYMYMLSLSLLFMCYLHYIHVSVSVFEYSSLLRTYPAHDSTSILLVRSANYRKHVESVREWYSTQHHNWQQVDGERSQWWVWEKAREVALTSAKQIQHYLARITSGEYNINLSTRTCVCTHSPIASHCKRKVTKGRCVKLFGVYTCTFAYSCIIYSRWH